MLQKCAEVLKSLECEFQAHFVFLCVLVHCFTEVNGGGFVSPRSLSHTLSLTLTQCLLLLASAFAALIAVVGLTFLRSNVNEGVVVCLCHKWVWGSPSQVRP
jgi:hypothetical protein